MPPKVEPLKRMKKTHHSSNNWSPSKACSQTKLLEGILKLSPFEFPPSMWAEDHVFSTLFIWSNRPVIWSANSTRIVAKRCSCDAWAIIVKNGRWESIKDGRKRGLPAQTIPISQQLLVGPESVLEISSSEECGFWISVNETVCRLAVLKTDPRWKKINGTKERNHRETEVCWSGILLWFRNWLKLVWS